MIFLTFQTIVNFLILFVLYRATKYILWERTFDKFLKVHLEILKRKRLLLLFNVYFALFVHQGFYIATIDIICISNATV